MPSPSRAILFSSKPAILRVIGKKPVQGSVRRSSSEENPSGSDRDTRHRFDGSRLRPAARPPNAALLLCGAQLLNRRDRFLSRKRWTEHELLSSLAAPGADWA